MSTAGHQEIDHTADLGFEVWAESPQSLFAEAVLALGDLCYDRAAVCSREQRRLRIHGASPEERLVRWLHEVYMLLESELWLTAVASDVTIEGDTVQGTLHGEPVERPRHTLHTEIKAITYHGLEIARSRGAWRAVVVVDV